MLLMIISDAGRPLAVGRSVVPPARPPAPMLRPPGPTALAEALRRGDLQQCARCLQHDPSLLHARGWNGFTPLHHAALCGHKELAYLLLEHGADTNLPNDAGETPFHFACRRGEVYIMDRMVKGGADVMALDHQGKTALHQAVSGGSIVAIRYLEEMGPFNFRDSDRFLQNPLHIATSIGNEDVVKYLLRGMRCSVEAIDTWGMTPLHVAAHTGSVNICWLLMMDAGISTMQFQNKDGLTPLDLAKRGKSHRHQEVVKLLTEYSKDIQNGKPRKPTGLYYSSLLCPAILSSIIFLIASHLGEYGGVFSAIAFAVLARIVFFQYHRISHYSGLPNPVYLGTFAAGIFHSLYCFYCKILPALWPAKMLLCFMTLLTTLLLWMFKNLLTEDPGNLQESGCTTKHLTIAQLIGTNQNPSRFCVYCEIVQPEGTKHCRLCNSCMENFDHHCLFLMKCIAKKNQRLFILFLLEILASHLTFITSALYSFHLQYSLNFEVFLKAFSGQPWVMGLTVMNIATVLWELVVLKSQLTAISMNSTTTCRDRVDGKDFTWRHLLRNITVFLIFGKKLQSSGRNLSSQF
ncbi:uncharacterized protein si:ch211-223a10.1 [Pristis pectinata]|uniref:uncharacterized protein si:ch211-223a10.1 n=1 Tax=Pristis pectinata TaxID=685728 RepID=UPI00223DBFCD|nr:uncharacterized protein si:ch211-223a10.1 [Pristis pectinata]